MPTGDEQLREEIADLRERVTRLEALAQSRPAEVREFPAPAVSAPPEKEASLEARIGSNLFNRIGIVAVLVGVAWFLKIAFENRWLGGVGKVSAGILAGLALFVWSEHFRRRGFETFSFSLKAVGAGLLYLSLWAAWSLFHLLSLPEAGAAMVLVAAGNGWLAWRRGSELLAFYAAIGGYLTPLLLANGQNHEVALFSYLLLLDAAALILAAFRAWPRLALGAFLASAAYATAWAAFYYTEPQFGVTLGFGIAGWMLFASVPYVVQGGVVRGGVLSGGERRSAIPVTVPVLNAVFALPGILLLFGVDGRAWACIGLCLLYLAIARPRQVAAMHLLMAGCFLLAAVSFGVHSYWAGSGVNLRDRAVDEQISYSAWFMLFGAGTLAAGFWRRLPALRWLGLIVLCLSIGKVFLVDMRTLSEGYRVLSFLGLGALLLGVSFVYQKDWLSLRGGRRAG